MTLVDLADLNAMRAERDAALAENARLRAAVGGAAAKALRKAAEIGTPGPAVMCRSPKDRDDQWRKALRDRAAALAAPTTEEES